MKKILNIIFIVFLLISCKKEPKEYSSISGQWRCEENSNTTPKVYTIDIEKSTSSNNRYAIYNFNNEGTEEKVYSLLRNDTLIIDAQFIGSGTISVEGFGFVSADKKTMRLEYELTEGTGVRSILSTCTHQ